MTDARQAEPMFAAPLLAAYAQHQRYPAKAQISSEHGQGVGPQDAQTAYAVQAAVWRQQVGGARPTVWKVGAAAPDAVPLAAPVFPQRCAQSPAQFNQADFFTLGVEAEIAFRFGRPLPKRAQPYSQSEIRAAIVSAHVAMELVDTRLADAEAAGPWWRLADNLLNGGFVLGDAIAGWQTRNFQTLKVRVLAQTAAGEISLTNTPGRPPLNDLFHCLPWWVAHVGDTWGGVEAGDVVTTGAWNGMHPLAMPAAVRVVFTDACANEGAPSGEAWSATFTVR